MSEDTCSTCNKRPPYCHCNQPREMPAVDSIEESYQAAAEFSGKTVEELKQIGIQVFASMLHHMLEKPDRIIWTVAKFQNEKLQVEVDFPPRGNGDSKQTTKCAVCGMQKHTPLRNDEMGGYVCLTCIDRELARLQSSNPETKR